MYSLRELYRTGFGPSSSHTIGPFRAAASFCYAHPARSYRVELYGSLAATGKGHFTDLALTRGFSPHSVDISWQPEVVFEQHPNGMKLQAMDASGAVLAESLVFSVGGGALTALGESLAEGRHVYPHSTMADILLHCKEKNIPLWSYVEDCEGAEIWGFLEEIRGAMMASIQEGLESEQEYLPAALKIRRRAREMFASAQQENHAGMREAAFLTAYAHAVAEQNASMGTVVTAPTCGACAVLPAVLRYMQESYRLSDGQITKALAVAGLLGLLAKHNASISGAEAGCQAEIGVACSMAAGAAAFLLGYGQGSIEYAAEVAMEHHLGLTCDPVGGFVLIPCIERNAVAAVRALQSAYYVKMTGESHLISYDEVLKTMKETGKDMREAYRETAAGGLAKTYRPRPQDFC